MKTVLLNALVLNASLLSFSCFAETQIIKLGALLGPDCRINEVLKEVSHAESLQIDVETFDDPIALVHELDEGRLDVAELPNMPFLEREAAAHHYKLSVVGYTVTLPIAIYSRKLTSLRALKSDDTVAIPKEALDRARALILLQNTGLIGLKDEAGYAATVADILDNPKNLRIVEVESADLPASLYMAAAAVIPFNDAAKSSLDPARDALLMEDGHSPYAEVLTVKNQNRDQSWVDKLVKAYHSEKIKSFILSEFNGAVRRPW